VWVPEWHPGGHGRASTALAVARHRDQSGDPARDSTPQPDRGGSWYDAGGGDQRDEGGRERDDHQPSRVVDSKAIEDRC